MIFNGIELIVITLIILALSLLIDLIFGELPTKIHPVVFIGKVIDFFSNYLRKYNNKFSGFILTISVSIVVLAVFAGILFLASFNIIIFILVASLVLSSTFSIKMLLSSAKNIKKDLECGIDVARKSMAYLVSRNTADLDEEMIISATIETLSENITDSAIAPIFYYLLTIVVILIIINLLSFFNLFKDFNHLIDYSILLSFKNLIDYSILLNFNYSIEHFIIVILAVLIAIIYRTINTLDAMVGYKNIKYINIGYFSAKLDDVLNYIPARFGGIIVVLASKFYKTKGINWKNSYNIMKRDARKPDSPNSGFTMAAVAGAMNISLVKKGIYVIGDIKNNKVLKREDIDKAIELSRLGINLAIILLILIFLIISAIIILFL